jgi:DNA mismatch repair protein MutS
VLALPAGKPAITSKALFGVGAVVALRDRVGAQAGRLQRAGDVLARLDMLAALAELAAARGYCRPELTDEPVLEIEGGRHPVLDQTLPPGTVVPNDARLGPEGGRVWLITGPNLSGKSTFIRQVALLTLMAQMGSFVPARRARIGIADRIFTRVGASDDLGRGVESPVTPAPAPDIVSGRPPTARDAAASL